MGCLEEINISRSFEKNRKVSKKTENFRKKTKKKREKPKKNEKLYILRITAVCERNFPL
jgi:hypothetical protein